MKILGVALLLFVVSATDLRAESARPSIEITPGKAKAFRVAVQRFLDEAEPPNSRRAQDLRDAIEEALRFDGVLLPIPNEAFLGDEDTKVLKGTRRYDCSNWSQSGADALVEGQISTDGPEMVIEFAVWDSARCKRLVREEIRRLPSQGPRMARRVADRIVEAFTGVPGAASTEIAYLSTRTGTKEIFVANADGSGARPATRSKTLKAFPAWLPNGAGILYTAYHDNAQPALFVTARTSEVKAGQILSQVFPGKPKYRGVIDPSGKRIAVVATVKEAPDIFRVDRKSGRTKQLTHSRAIDISPSWSPDGEQIVFVSDRSGSPQLYIMDSDGENSRRLTFEGTYNTAPAWSPDGRWIAYETRLEAQFDIWITDPRGEVHIPLVQHRRSDETPAWSPDGRKIAFTSNRRGRYDVYVVDLNGENLRRLTENAGNNTHPVWGPFPQ